MGVASILLDGKNLQESSVYLPGEMGACFHSESSPVLRVIVLAKQTQLFLAAYVRGLPLLRTSGRGL